MKYSIFSLIVIFGGANATADQITGLSPRLEYETREGDNLLIYKSAKGETYKVFDHGLNFHYNLKDQSSHNSTDGLYSIIPFSEIGTQEIDDDNDTSSNPQEVTFYLCAFIRLSDGCITRTETGEQCGGEWGDGHTWHSRLYRDNSYLFESNTTAENVYRDYSSRRLDSIIVSSPRILAYLMEGTAFDNLLTCDPPTTKNVQTYIELRDALQADGDMENSGKITNKILPLVRKNTEN